MANISRTSAYGHALKVKAFRKGKKPKKSLKNLHTYSALYIKSHALNYDRMSKTATTLPYKGL